MSYVGFAFLVLLCGALLMRPLRAQTIAGNLSPTLVTTKETCNDKVQITGFTISPAQPSAGQAVTVTLTFKHACTSGDAKNIPWAIFENNVILGEGTYNGVAPGQTISISRTWTAQIGTHAFFAYIDPVNTFNESSTFRPNNLSQTISVTVNADWNAVKNQTKSAVTQMVNSWKSQAALKDVTISGPMATGGRISPMSFRSAMYDSLVNSGIPAEIANAMSRALSQQWEKWSSSLTVPGLPWYPTFAAFPGPAAPAVPNVPSPLLTLAQCAECLSAPALTQEMNAGLGPYASLPGAAEAVRDIGTWMNGCFVLFAANVQVTNVMGSGTVPTFAPPYVPVGPVLGKGNQNPGGMLGSWCP